MRKRKYEINPYSFYDLTGMQKHLETMAAKGWFLDQMTNLTWRYHRDTPKKLHYCVSYYLKASVYEPEPSEEQQAFQELCEHAGWNLAAQNGKMLVLCNERPNPVPVHTDPMDEIEAIEEISFSTLGHYALYVFMTLCYLGMTWIGLRDHAVETLGNGVILAGVVIMCVGTLFDVVDAIQYFWWKIRAKKAAEYDEFIPTPTGIHRLVVPMLTIILFLYFFSVLFQPESPRKTGMIAEIAIVVAAIYMTGKLTQLMKKKKVSEETNALVSNLVPMAFILAAVFTVMYFTLGRERPDPDLVSKLVISAEELTGREDDRYEELIDVRESVFVTRMIGRQMAPEESDLKDLDYHIVDVHFDELLNLCLEDYLHKYDRTTWCQGRAYQTMDPKQWRADQVWELSEEDGGIVHYLVRYGNRIVEIIANWTLTDEQIELCAQRFMP